MRLSTHFGLVVCGVAAVALLFGGCNGSSGGAAACGLGRDSSPVTSCSWSGPGDGSAESLNGAFIAGGNYVLTFHGKTPTCQYDVSEYGASPGGFWHFVLQSDGTIYQSFAGGPPASLSAAGTVSLPLQDLSPGIFQMIVTTSGTFNSQCPWDATMKQ